MREHIYFLVLRLNRSLGGLSSEYIKNEYTNLAGFIANTELDKVLALDPYVLSHLHHCLDNWSRDFLEKASAPSSPLWLFQAWLRDLSLRGHQFQARLFMSSLPPLNFPCFFSC